MWYHAHARSGDVPASGAAHEATRQTDGAEFGGVSNGALCDTAGALCGRGIAGAELLCARSEGLRGKSPAGVGNLTMT